MKKVLRMIVVAAILSVLILPQIMIGKIYAEDVKFSGITAPISVNVRSGPTLTAQSLYQLTASTTVNFDGWVYGDSVNDYWSGKADNRWFFFINDKQEKLYIASGMVKGNPPSIPGDATVPNVHQVESNWCWAAASSSVLQHYNLTISQQQVAIFVKGGLVNETATNYDIVAVLQHFGLNASSFDDLPSYEQIESQINNGNPMITLIDWRSGGGHFQVLDGYFSNSGREYIKIMDPWYGDHYDYAYDYYKSNSKFWWNLYIDSFSRK